MRSLFKIGQSAVGTKPSISPVDLDGLEPQSGNMLHVLSDKLHEAVQIMDQIISSDPRAVLASRSMQQIRNEIARIASQAKPRDMQYYQRTDRSGNPMTESKWLEMQQAGGDGTGDGPYYNLQ